ncbi:hypothetical protein GW17_00049183 [Ensete ventricosum]|nr:hypothetical protein GW17_00049183 [Ensete ventricosum]
MLNFQKCCLEIIFHQITCRIQERRNHLLSQIDEVRRTRALQRSARRRHGSSYGQGLATVAVVGYTNAGKSTLVSALSESDLYSDDRYSYMLLAVSLLFATVDPRVRSVVLPSGKKVLLSDTVGFISDLPVQLVEAFHATLEEVVEADLLVIDLLESNSGADECFGEEEITGEDEEYPEDDMTCDPSSGKPADEDDDAMASEFSREESPDNADDVASEFSCGGHMDDNDDGDIASDVSTEEVLENFDNKDADSVVKFVTKDSGEHHESKNINCVKASAMTGVGLQELLNLIDHKLNKEESDEKRTFGPWDRKWRPSDTADDEKAAEQ